MKLSDSKAIPFYSSCIIVSIAIIFAMGITMIYNTFSAEILDLDLPKNPHLSLFKQILYGIIGCLAGWCIWWVGYKKIVSCSFYISAFLVFLLALILIPGVAQSVNGSKRWLMIGSLSLQPSELAKLFLPLCYLKVISQTPNIVVSFRSFLTLVAGLSAPIGLILLEPDIVASGIVCITIVMLFYITGVKARFWAAPLLFFLCVGIVAISQFSYAKKRIEIYLHPEKDLLGKGHQPFQAKIATGSGQLTGKGLGKSLQKLNYLPEAQNDYIAAIYAEEMGFIGILCLITLYMLITYCGFRIATSIQDEMGAYVAALIIFLISVQAFLNLGVVSTLLPSKGLNLPFFSQGGTNLITNFMAIGLLMSVAQPRKTFFSPPLHNRSFIERN